MPGNNKKPKTEEELKAEKQLEQQSQATEKEQAGASSASSDPESIETADRESSAKPADGSSSTAEAAHDEAAGEKAELLPSEGELEELKEQLRKSEEQYLRLAAEFDNFRKRSRKEKDQIYGQAKADAVKSILPVLDSLDRAIENMPEQFATEEARAMGEGLTLVLKQALDCLMQIGIEPIEAEGKAFDPEFHDALTHIQDENLGENVIVKVVLKGYRMGDNVIRHAAVIVAN